MITLEVKALPCETGSPAIIYLVEIAEWADDGKDYSIWKAVKDFKDSGFIKSKFGAFIPWHQVCNITVRKE